MASPSNIILRAYNLHASKTQEHLALPNCFLRCHLLHIVVVPCSLRRHFAAFATLHAPPALTWCTARTAASTTSTRRHEEVDRVSLSNIPSLHSKHATDLVRQHHDHENVRDGGSLSLWQRILATKQATSGQTCTTANTRTTS